MRKYLIVIFAAILVAQNLPALVVKNDLTNHLSLFPGDTQKASSQLYNETDTPISVNLYPLLGHYRESLY